MATSTISVNPLTYTLLGSAPMLIRTASAIGLTGQAGTATPAATAAFTVLSGNDTPFSWPIAQNVFAIALGPTIPGQPSPVASVGVSII